MNDGPLPLGTYRLRLVRAQHRTGRLGQWFISCRFEAVDPPYAGVGVYHTVVVDSVHTFGLDHLCEALQVDPLEFVRRPDLLAGRDVHAFVKIREWSGGARQHNEIVKMYPLKR